MGGDALMIDLDSIGAPLSILSGWVHSYDRLRLNMGTTQHIGWGDTHLLDLDSIGTSPGIWMGGDTDITDIDSKGTQPGILDGWGHPYDRHRLNQSTNQFFGWAGTLIC